MHEIRFLTQPADKSVWVQAVIRKGDLARLGVSYSQLLKRAQLSSDWRIAQIEAEPDVICLEKKSPDSYQHRPADELMRVVDGIRPALWSSVLIVPPYVKYYLYVAPKNGRSAVLPQLLSMYLVMFFFGSITRYQPHHFERLIDSKYGAQIEGSLNDIPSQFLYLLASEFLKRDVSKAAIV
jgi:YaaC-like Protein